MKYCTIILYGGEISGYNIPSDCWQFDSIKEAADWLFRNSYAKSTSAAISGLSNILRGTVKHYKGFTISVAYAAGVGSDVIEPLDELLHTIYVYVITQAKNQPAQELSKQSIANLIKECPALNQQMATGKGSYRQ